MTAESDALALATGVYWIGWRQLRLILGANHCAVSGMRQLPPDLLQRIAQLAHRNRARVLPRFNALTDASLGKNAATWEVSIEEMRSYVTLLNDGRTLQSFVGFEERMLRIPWRTTFQYFELQFHIWCGTFVEFRGGTEDGGSTTSWLTWCASSSAVSSALSALGKLGAARMIVLAR